MTEPRTYGTYQKLTVETPPTLIQHDDGAWFVQISHGDLTVEAPIGEWFATQVLEKLVLPHVPK